MKKSLVLLTIFLSSIHTYAQHITFRVQNFESHLPLPKVKISSTLHKRILSYSNDSGYFSLDVNHQDTLLIEKEKYHSIYMNIKANDFDTSHIIEISMVPWVKKEVNSKDLSTLQLFEYHFVHDTLKDNEVKVHIFEGVDATSKRTSKADPSFRIATAKIKPRDPHHKLEQQEKSLYKEK